MGCCSNKSEMKNGSGTSSTRTTRTVFHGTSKNAADNILKSGFSPSSVGGRGAGVYFTDSKQTAK